MHHPARLEQLDFQGFCAGGMGVRMSVRKNSPRSGDTGAGGGCGRLVRRGMWCPGAEMSPTTRRGRTNRTHVAIHNVLYQLAFCFPRRPA